MTSSIRAADVAAADEPDPAPRTNPPEGGHTATPWAVRPGQWAMTSAVPPAGRAGAALGRPSWPIRSGMVPALANGYSARPETAPGLAAALPAGAAVGLVPVRSAPPAAFPGPVAAPDAQDWLRS